jgi:primary-amine oxidase
VDDARRMFQVFFYTRDPKNPKEKDSNHYAFPLPISVVVDLHNFAVVRVEQLPTGVDDSLPPLKPYKVPPPNEYNPNYHILRTDLKPLNVVQPEGVSFTATQGGQGGGETISWQKWKFQIGFNMREGSFSLPQTKSYLFDSGR